MSKRPALLFLSSLLFLYFPLEWSFRTYYSHHFSWIEALLLGVVPILLILGLIKVTKVGWYTLVAMIALWGIQDLHSFYSTRGQEWRLLSHLGIYLFTLSYFITPRVRHLYFDPKTHWWRTKPRFETHTPVVTQSEAVWGHPMMKNISEGGCFLETRQPLPVHSQVTLNILLPIPLRLSVLNVKGEVRWVSRSANRPGMGVQFSQLSYSHLEAIRDFLKLGL
jgi:uncharacterized protein (TIGR02266 family)